MLSIDDESCIECGICVDLLPQYFEVEGGKVRVRGTTGSAAGSAAPDPDLLGEAKRDCPTGSIRS
jgi:ferredoxin